MLIINADDVGRVTAATDLALSCYERRRITAASAMVFMDDSERAAELASAHGIEIGLHINLSEAFSAKSVSGSLREDHERVCRFLTSNKYALLIYNPVLSREFRRVVNAQFDEFHRLYGKPPSHLDGHQHMHLASNILAHQILPPGSTVRASFSPRHGERASVKSVYRALVRHRLRRHYRTSDYFFALSHHLCVERLEHVIALARDARVELMTHPAVPREYEFMMSDAFGRAIAAVGCASHAAL
jgi:predicted glycoside hydrolase/deacetylase ChbG (UPF0249 family)